MYEFKGTPGPWLELRPDVTEYPTKAIGGLYTSGLMIATIWDKKSLRDVFDQSDEAIANYALIKQSPELLQKSQDLLTWLHVQHPEEGTVHCLACRNVTDPEDASNGKFNHHEECPVVPLAKVIFKALGVEE